MPNRDKTGPFGEGEHCDDPRGRRQGKGFGKGQGKGRRRGRKWETIEAMLRSKKSDKEE